MESFWIVGSIIVIFSSVFVAVKKNADKLKLDQGKRTNLTHKECIEESSKDCIHIYGSAYVDRKTCKNCGHKNEKNAKRCSVCGTRFWL